MIVIKHKGGWSCSNSAEINIDSTPVYTNGKITSVKRDRACIISGLFTVKGVFDGDVKIAIKDDSTGDISFFTGLVDGKNRIKIIDECDKDWLNSLK